MKEIGLVARNIYENNVNADVTLVDIDSEVIKLSREYARIRELNKDSLLKCEIIIDNALDWVPKCKEKYDIIICDFPDPNSEVLKKLYEESFYKEISKLVKDKGVVSIQCHDDVSDDVYEKIQKVFKSATRVEYKMPFLCGGEIVLGRK